MHEPPPRGRACHACRAGLSSPRWLRPCCSGFRRLPPYRAAPPCRPRELFSPAAFAGPVGSILCAQCGHTWLCGPWSPPRGQGTMKAWPNSCRVGHAPRWMRPCYSGFRRLPPHRAAPPRRPRELFRPAAYAGPVGSILCAQCGHTWLWGPGSPPRGHGTMKARAPGPPFIYLNALPSFPITHALALGPRTGDTSQSLAPAPAATWALAPRV